VLIPGQDQLVLYGLNCGLLQEEGEEVLEEEVLHFQQDSVVVEQVVEY
jgi:hypothetical protein